MECTTLIENEETMEIIAYDAQGSAIAYWTNGKPSEELCLKKVSHYTYLFCTNMTSISINYTVIQRAYEVFNLGFPLPNPTSVQVDVKWFLHGDFARMFLLNFTIKKNQ